MELTRGEVTGIIVAPTASFLLTLAMTTSIPLSIGSAGMGLLFYVMLFSWRSWDD